MDAPMGRKAVQIPVFLVNEAQMDELSPPKRKQALDPRYVKEWLDRRRDPDEPPPDINQLDFNNWEAFV
jgi:hypothetical protein